MSLLCQQNSPESIAMEQQSLKKLNFVPEYGTKGYNMAANAYTTAKSYVPSSMKEHVTKVEETVAAVSAPYVTKAQDKGSELLKAVDEQVRFSEEEDVHKTAFVCLSLSLFSRVGLAWLCLKCLQ